MVMITVWCAVVEFSCPEVPPHARLALLIVVPVEFDDVRPENHTGHFVIDTVPNITVTTSSGSVTRKTTMYKLTAVASLIEDVMEDKFQCYLVSDNQVLLAMPSTPRILRPAGRAQCRDAESKYAMYNVQEAEQRDINMNAISNDLTHQTRLFLVKFDGIKLTNDHYSPNSQDGKIDYEFCPVPSVYVVPGAAPLGSYLTPVTWKFTEVPPTESIVTQQTKSTDNVGMLAQMMANANMGHRTQPGSPHTASTPSPRTQSSGGFQQHQHQQQQQQQQPFLHPYQQQYQQPVSQCGRPPVLNTNFAQSPQQQQHLFGDPLGPFAFATDPFEGAGQR